MTGRPRRRSALNAPAVRLAIAVVAILAIAVVGIGATVLGLVPHRVPTPTLDTSVQSHDFPDLERIVPRVVDGRATEAVGSFTGTDAADDESMYGGVYTVVSDEIATTTDPDGLDRLQIAEGFVPGGTAANWTVINAYRLPGRTAAGWQPTLDSLLTRRLELQIWAFRPERIANRDVLVGRDETGTAGDWVYRSGDVVFEINGDNPVTVEHVLERLP